MPKKPLVFQAFLSSAVLLLTGQLRNAFCVAAAAAVDAFAFSLMMMMTKAAAAAAKTKIVS